MEVFIGTILPFGFTFAPQNWISCNGQILSISQNSALFSLIGTIYGGNGVSTFGVPDLGGRAAVGQNSGYVMGQVGGTETVSLVTANLPAHTHTLAGTTAAAGATVPDGTNSFLANANGEDVNLGSVTVKIYGPAGTPVPLAPQSIGLTGSNTPVSVMQPYLALNYCMALYGLFPSRP